MLWKWAVSSDARQLLARALEEPAHLHRVRHAGRVAERDLLAPGVREPPRDPEHALERHVALVGAAERHRDHALAAQPRFACPRDHPLQPRQRLLDRAVHVLRVVRLARRQEQVHLVELEVARERALEPALVRDQHRVGDIGVARDRAQHLLGVGELRDHVRPHERRHLEPPQARLRQAVDQPRPCRSVAITSGSFWKPSRGPTSRMRTCSGSTPLDHAQGRRSRRASGLSRTRSRGEHRNAIVAATSSGVAHPAQRPSSPTIVLTTFSPELAGQLGRGAVQQRRVDRPGRDRVAEHVEARRPRARSSS